jgi:hypothetical protein
MKSGEVLGTPFSGGRTIIKNPSYFNSGLIFPCRTSLTTMPAITSVTLNYGQARESRSYLPTDDDQQNLVGPDAYPMNTVVSNFSVEYLE